MGEIAAYVLLGIMLIYCAGTDIKRKVISGVALGIFAGVGLVLQIAFRFISIPSMLGGIGLGIAVMLVSKLTKGGIGLGDGELLCVTGLYVGFYENLEIFLLALFMAAVWGIVLIVFKKAGRKTELPFVPFLTMAYVIVAISRVGKLISI